MHRLKNEAAFQRHLRASLGYTFFQKCKFFKTHGNEYTEKGVSDLVGHIHGNFIAIECKMWKGRPTTEQLAFCRGMLKTGAMGIFAIYRYEDGVHTVHWCPADMAFSYRMQMIWPVSRLVSVDRDPLNPDGRKIEMFDCKQLLPLLEMNK